jgi:type III secretion system YscQ/HrcQ family protein
LRARLDRPHAACVAVTIVVESVSVTIHLWIVEGVVTRDASPPGYNAPLTHALLREHALLSARLIGICRLTAHAASALLLDDVIMLQAAGIAATADGYHGTVTVAVLGARTHHWVARAQGDRIELEQLHTTKDDRMTTGKIESGDAPTTETLTAITDAPLELSVEIARFTLPLGEIARLSIGDVLLTGRPIGEHVTLRAGTRAIGTGELISVDGAIGVRIVTLAGA